MKTITNKVIEQHGLKLEEYSTIKKLLKSYTDIIHSDIPTIEKYGGGSARCMLTELF